MEHLDHNPPRPVATMTMGELVDELDQIAELLRYAGPIWKLFTAMNGLPTEDQQADLLSRRHDAIHSEIAKRFPPGNPSSPEESK